MGQTPTRTLGMRLSCNFVNVYTIVYHVQYTYTCTRAHLQLTSSRGKARVRGQVVRACPARGELNGPRAPVGLRQDAPTSACAGHADFRARILARKLARKSVSVSVSVQWNLSLRRHVYCALSNGKMTINTSTGRFFHRILNL